MGHNNPEFEWDPEKSHINFIKHGLGLDTAMELWEVTNIEGAAKAVDTEQRYFMTGLLCEKLYTCIFTLRGKRIRIISLRRSWQAEEKKYHEETEKKDDHSGGV